MNTVESNLVHPALNVFEGPVQAADVNLVPTALRRIGRCRLDLRVADGNVEGSQADENHPER